MPRTPPKLFKTPLCSTSSTLLQPPPRFFCNILQHFFATLSYISTTRLSETPVPSSTTSLHTFPRNTFPYFILFLTPLSNILLYNTSVQLARRELFCNTPPKHSGDPQRFLQHACTQLLGNTSFASFPTLFCNTYPLHSATTLRHNTFLQLLHKTPCHITPLKRFSPIVLCNTPLQQLFFDTTLTSW